MEGATWDIPQKDLDGLDLTLSDSSSKKLYIHRVKKETKKSLEMLKDFWGLATDVMAVIGWALLFLFIFDALFLNARLLSWFIAG